MPQPLEFTLAVSCIDTLLLQREETETLSRYALQFLQSKSSASAKTPIDVVPNDGRAMVITKHC